MTPDAAEVSGEMDVADVLDAAADYIRAHGLYKLGFGFDGGPKCLLGAMREAWAASTLPTSSQHDGIQLWTSTTPVVQDVIGTSEIAKWNDAPERTAHEVIDALMEAAARLRTQERR